MIHLLIDADSHIFASCFNKEKPDGFEDDVEEAFLKFENYIQGIWNSLYEQGVFPEDYKMFVQGSNNFRRVLFKDYKANRSKRDLPPLLGELRQLVVERCNAFVCNGADTDDFVACTWRYLTDKNHKVILAANDKDYKQLPCDYFDLYYNRFGEITVISEEEAMRNLFTQMIAGDSADNIKGAKGSGPKRAEKIFEGAKTWNQYVFRTYREYLKKRKIGSQRDAFHAAFTMVKLIENGLKIPALTEFDLAPSHDLINS